MSRIYFYKMTVDNGGAPCVEKGLLSLAICKPMIRSTAKIGDILIGFAADSLHADNRLIYIAEVTDKRFNGDYFKLPQYASRSDCIYEWRGGRFAARAGAKYHGTPADLEHDLGAAPSYERANTLLSEKFCYFGSGGSADYKKAQRALGAKIESLKQGHRVEHGPELLDELEELVAQRCALSGPCVLGESTSKPEGGGMDRGGGCGVIERKKRC